MMIDKSMTEQLENPEALRKEYFEKAKSLSEQILLLIKSEFPNKDMNFYGVMNTLALAIIKYSIDNSFNFDHVLHALSIQYTSELNIRLKQAEEKLKNTSIN